MTAARDEKQAAIRRMVDASAPFLLQILRDRQIPCLAVAACDSLGILHQRVLTSDAVRSHDNPLFQLGSQSKFLTALCVLRLVGKGRLRVSDRILDWLPEARALRDAPLGRARIIDLLRHASPLAACETRLLRRADGHGQKPGPAPMSRDALLLHIRRGPFNTGYSGRASFRYSDFGYALLGVIIAEASARRYEDVARDIAASEAGAKDVFTSRRAVPAAHRDRLLAGEDVVRGVRRRFAVQDLQALNPAQGIIASASSAAQLFHAGLSGALVSRRLTRMIADSAIAIPPAEAGRRYGLGVTVFEPAHQAAAPRLGHLGILNGFCGAAIHHSGLDVTVSCQVNCAAFERAGHHRQVFPERLVRRAFDLLECELTPQASNASMLGGDTTKHLGLALV